MSFYDVFGNTINPMKNFVDVTAYGAKGNGVTDDASAIQAALDALKDTGGIIHFPYGTYMINKALLFYSNQTLLFTKGAKILRGVGSLNSLIRNFSTTDFGGYSATHDVQIIGATFDGSETYTTNLTAVGFCHSQGITIKDCVFKNIHGSWHDVEVNSSKNVLIEKCEFYGDKKTASNGETIQLDMAYSSGAYPWGDSQMDSTKCSFVEIRDCVFHDNAVSPAIGTHSQGGTNIRIHGCVFESNTGERCTINLGSTQLIDCYNNTFSGCTNCFYSHSGSTFHDNRVTGATNIVSDTTTVAYNNFVDGAIVS